MANSQRDPEREQFWREAIERQAASGLSVREFCRREQLAETSFFAWRRTIRQRDGEAEPSRQPAFVPAVVTSRSPADTSIILELPSGHTLKLPESISAVRLAELVHALEAQA